MRMLTGCSKKEQYRSSHKPSVLGGIFLVLSVFLFGGCAEQYPVGGGNGLILPKGAGGVLPQDPSYETTPDNRNVVIDVPPQALGSSDGVLVKFKNTAASDGRARALGSAGLRESGNFALVPGLTRAQVQAGFTLRDTLQNLALDPSVAYAEPDYLLTIAAVPNDPSFNQQYGLQNISAPTAWDTQTGSQGTVIAVIDTGVDYNHPDLANNMWQNPGEVAGNRRDDDGNGFVDDVRGWDFATNANDPMDQNNHGTHVAGIIAAQGNNGVGVSGVNWRAQIMPLRFMDAQGVGTTSAAIRAVEYAVANGARVSNNSWGGGVFSQALFDAIQAANAAGHVFVAAAGNDGLNNDTNAHYPSSYNLPNIISVAATDTNDQLTSFSNFGVRSVDVAAPGLRIFSTVRGNNYQSLSGTSMASPFVAGIVGLVLSQNSTLPVADVRNAILNTVDSIGGLNGVVASGGRVNAAAALAAVQAGPAPSPTPTPNPTPNPTPTPTPTPTPNPTPTPSPSVVTISPLSAEIPIGGSFNFRAQGGTPPYSWSVSSPAIASIDSATGVFTASTIGSVQVTATDSVGIASAPSNVTVTNILITPARNQLQLNESVTFSVAGGKGPYTWNISNDAVVSATPQGTGNRSVVISAAVQGQFTLTVTDVSGNNVTSNLAVVVTPMALDPVTSSIRVGEQLQLNVTGGTSPYTWDSSNTSVATVDGGGLVRGVAGGTVTITATDVTGFAQSANITVVEVATPISLTPTSSTVVVNDLVQLVATGGTGNFTWSSNNTSVATVSNTGWVTGVAPGSARITVSDNAGNSASSNINVNASITPVIVLGPATGTNMTVGGTVQLTASGGDTSAPYTWSSSNTSICTVDNNGLVRGVSGGAASITATDIAGNSGVISVFVDAPAGGGGGGATPAPAPAPAPAPGGGGGMGGHGGM